MVLQVVEYDWTNLWFADQVLEAMVWWHEVILIVVEVNRSS